ncbi:MAG: NUDIX domain-containing protein [Roseibium sp.]
MNVGLKMLKLIAILPKSWTRRLIHGFGLIRNPYTLGVRVIVEDAQNRILLVRHSYLKGWYLPGGAVDAAETLHDAAIREVLEEAGIYSGSPATLLNIYLNDRDWGRDRVGLFHLADWSETASYLQPNKEIAEARFFEFDDLPLEITGATLSRIQEFRSGTIPSGGRWISSNHS